LPGRSIAFDFEGVVFHGNRYRRLTVSFDAALSTVRYAARDGRVPAGSRAIVPLLHGFGAQYSHAGSMISTAMGVLKSRRPPGNRAGRQKRGRFSLVTELLRTGRHISCATEAIDLPFHGAGPEDAELRHLDGVVDWLSRALRQLRSYGLPVVPVARSGSSGLLLSALERSPELADAIVLSAPCHPVIGFDACTRRDDEDIARGAYVPNVQGRAWFVEINRALAERWPRLEKVLERTPALVLVSPADTDTPVEARRAFEQGISRGIARGAPSAYREITGAAHDLLAPEPPHAALEAYALVFDFVRSAVERAGLVGGLKEG
jgi:alpha-beta hydrolase superfamily lysophospholipase